MGGFGEDAAQPRMVRGAEVNALLSSLDQLADVVERSVRDRVLEIRAEVEADVDGVFEPQDLGWLNGRIGEMRARLASLRDSFPPGPPGPP